MFRSIRSALDFLPPRLRWQWRALVPLLLLCAGMELLAAVALVRFIAIVSGRNVLPLPFAESAAATGIFVGVLFLVKNALFATAIWAQNRLTARSISSVFQRLIHTYLASPYINHLQRNTSDRMYAAMEGIDVVYRLVLASAAGLLTEIAVAILLAAVLIVYTPAAALSVTLVTLAIVAAILAMTRRAVARWGRAVYETGNAIWRELQQTLAVFKQIKAMRRESFFADRAAAVHRRYALAFERHLTILAVPRLAAETLFVLVALAIYFTLQHRTPTADLLPLLGLFAYTAFRIIPSATRILYDLDQLRHGEHAVARVAQELAQATEAVIEQPIDDRGGTIEIDGVSFTYPSAAQPALSNVSISIGRGECIGLAGASGSGKTTLLDLIAGLLQPSDGKLVVDGRVGYVPQEVVLLDDTVEHNVAFGVADSDVDSAGVARSLRLAQMRAFFDQQPERIDAAAGERGVTFSTGQRQRIGIARALYVRPSILLLDEPTAAVDPATEEKLMEVLQAMRGEMTMIIAAHRTDLLRACDRVIALRDGRIESVTQSRTQAPATIVETRSR